MAATEYEQLSFDLDALACRVDRLADRRRIKTPAAKLLAELVRVGLDERALMSAAALVLELDRPRTTA
jgi:hypothetical protein